VLSCRSLGLEKENKRETSGACRSLESGSTTICRFGIKRYPKQTINILNISLPIYVRYVDNILLAGPSDSVDIILNIFNSFHLRLQFTLELDGDKLDFLDITIVQLARVQKLDCRFHSERVRRNHAVSRLGRDAEYLRP